MRTLVAIVILSTLFLVGCRRTVVVKPRPVRPGAVVVAPAPGYVAVKVAPPRAPAVVVVKPRRPGPKYVWRKGHYVHRGGGYVWVKGAWVRPPRAGRVWVPGHHVRGKGWRPGHWR